MHRVLILKEGRKHGKYVRSSAAARLASRLTEAAIDGNKRHTFACAKGCDWCCYIQTDVFAGEAFVLADAVRRMPDEQRERVIERLGKNAARFSKMSLTDRQSAKIPCAFLNVQQGACSVYESRPSACRRWHGLDAQACKANFETQDGNPVVDPVAMHVAVLVATAYRKAMKEPVGELHRGVMMALDPDAERRFSRGEPVFDGWTSTDQNMTEEELRNVKGMSDSIADSAKRIAGV
jgi:hypothetical protein